MRAARVHLSARGKTDAKGEKGRPCKKKRTLFVCFTTERHGREKEMRKTMKGRKNYLSTKEAKGGDT